MLDGQPSKLGTNAGKESPNSQSGGAKKPTTTTPEVQDTVTMSRRGFLGLLGVTLIGGLAAAYGMADKNEESEETKERPQELKEIAETIESFMNAFEKDGKLTDNELYSLYEKELEKLGRKNTKELQIDAFRDAMVAYMLEKMTLTREEKEMLTQNKYYIGRMIHLAHMMCHDKNIAGGKRQIDPKAVIAKNFKRFKEGHKYGIAIAGSKKLAELIDPNLLFALIRNETDFVNFYNKSEGVAGPFQFTTAMPPKNKNTFDMPENVDARLEGLKANMSKNLVQYVLLLRKKLYNEFYDKLDDIEDTTIRKEVALGVAWLHANMGAIQEYYKDNPMVKDAFAWLMAIAFYNADIARISEDIKENTTLPDRIESDSVSGFIETLPFYKGSGAGKLYTPRAIVGYELLRALEAEDYDASKVNEKDLYASLLINVTKANCGLVCKGE